MFSMRFAPRMSSGDGLGPELWRFLCFCCPPKRRRNNFIDFSLFQLFSFLKLWDLHHSEKPEFVSMNCLKDSSRDGLELEIQTSRPRKITKRAFLVGGILVGIKFSVTSKIIGWFFFFAFWLFGLVRLWDLYQYEKPEFVSMNCLKDSSRHGLELEIQTSGPRKTSIRAFLVGGF